MRTSKRVWLSTLIYVGCTSSLATAQGISQASLTESGGMPNGQCLIPRLSSDGRVVAFTTNASNLTAGDTNGMLDVYVRDLGAGTTERISVSSTGMQGSHHSSADALSADGRFVVFGSYASELVPGDTNQREDVFLRDRASGVTERISVGTGGVQGVDGSNSGSIGDDGVWVAFQSYAHNLVPGDANAQADVFVRNRITGVTYCASLTASGVTANGVSFGPVLSGDASKLAFASYATNLVPGDDNGRLDVFVRDLATGAIELISVSETGMALNNGSYAPSLSRDGRYVTFETDSTNVVSGDTNGHSDVFVRDRVAQTTRLVSVSTGGGVGNASSIAARISADGRHVTFRSHASNLVGLVESSYLSDVFVRDLALGVTTLTSFSSAGNSFANGDSDWPEISADGRFVTFASRATDLLPGGSSSVWKVYLADRHAPVANYCRAKINSAGCTPSIFASGVASASAGRGFDIGATQVLDQQNGLLFYGVSGGQRIVFQDGLLCVQGPQRRTPVQIASDAGAPPCVGTYTFDFNAHIASHVDPELTLGTTVWAQYWSRDSASPSGTGLTDGLRFSIGF